MPALPQSTINEMELAFHCGANSYKRMNETVVPFGTKYTDSQLLHLLAFLQIRLSGSRQASKHLDNIPDNKGSVFC